MKTGPGRCRLMAVWLGALVLPGVGGAAAQDYPNRPIKWVISFPAGGANDVVARIIGQAMSEQLGQQVIIENKVGAGGSLGMPCACAVSRRSARARGHDFRSGAGDVRQPAELNGAHQERQARALAVTVGKRWFALPDVPTVGETVPGFETSLWYGIVAPSGTPPEIVNKLHRTIAAVLADPKIVARLAELGGEPMPLSPADFGKLIVEDTEKWAKVIKAASVKVE